MWRLGQVSVLDWTTYPYLGFFLASLMVSTGGGSSSSARRPQTLEFDQGLLEARLVCPSHVQRSESLKCEVYLLARPEGGILVVPGRLFPFKPRFGPDAHLEFEAQDGKGPAKLLRVASEAFIGRYEGSADGFKLLGRGELFGWRLDLNGKDWLLPPNVIGSVRIRAIVTLNLFASAEEPFPAVKKFLGRHLRAAKNVVPDGVFRSNEVEVVIE